MANKPEVTYKITIENKSSRGKGSTSAKMTSDTVGGSVGKEDSSFWKTGFFGANDEAKQGITKGLAVYHTVKGFVDNAVSYEVSTVTLRTGSNRMQEEAQLRYKIYSKASGVLESVSKGALVGGLPGAIVGLGISGIREVIGIGQRQNTLNLERALEDTSIQMASIRAGINNSRNN